MNKENTIIKSKTKSNNEISKGDSRPSGFSFLLFLAMLVFIVFVFKDFMLDANNIPSGSMMPTLEIGDYLFVNKMRYSLRVPLLNKKNTRYLPFLAPLVNKDIYRIDNPKRGDIITFAPPTEDNKHYVKRVMGMPHDRIRIREVSGCTIRREKNKQSTKSPESQAKDDKSTKLFSCKSSLPKLREPVVARVEYRPHDRGEWKNYPIEELSPQETYQELVDSDDASVLELGYFQANITNKEYYPYNLPILYREKVGEKEHLIIESKITMDSTQICPDIYTKGCLIPPEHYFVMGDNRDQSEDSRRIGYVHRSVVYGKPIMIYFSINWRDKICSFYWQRFQYSRALSRQPHNIDNSTDNAPVAGFPLSDFSPQEQAEFCSEYDFYKDNDNPFIPANSFFALFVDYLHHTIRYRIPRMSVRWARGGTFLE